MLSIESVVDELVVFLDVVQNEVSVVLGSSCENDHFENLGHVFQELDASGAKFEFFLFGHEVHQCFVKVENQGVLTLNCPLFLRNLVRQVLLPLV